MVIHFHPGLPRLLLLRPGLSSGWDDIVGPRARREKVQLIIGGFGYLPPQFLAFRIVRKVCTSQVIPELPRAQRSSLGHERDRMNAAISRVSNPITPPRDCVHAFTFQPGLSTTHYCTVPRHSIDLSLRVWLFWRPPNTWRPSSEPLFNIRHQLKPGLTL